MKEIERLKLQWQRHNMDNGLSWNEVGELVNQVVQLMNEKTGQTDNSELKQKIIDYRNAPYGERANNILSEIEVMMEQLSQQPKPSEPLMDKLKAGIDGYVSSWARAMNLDDEDKAKLRRSYEWVSKESKKVNHNNVCGICGNDLKLDKVEQTLKDENCPICGGVGHMGGFPQHLPCHNCDGTGKIQQPKPNEPTTEQSKGVDKMEPTEWFDKMLHKHSKLMRNNHMWLMGNEVSRDFYNRWHIKLRQIRIKMIESFSEKYAKYLNE